MEDDDRNRVSLPSAAERRRINEINRQEKELTQSRGRKRKAVDPLHNPDGASPLVVVPAPPADQWIQPEREKRIRKERKMWEPDGQKLPRASSKKTTKK